MYKKKKTARARRARGRLGKKLEICSPSAREPARQEQKGLVTDVVRLEARGRVASREAGTRELRKKKKPRALGTERDRNRETHLV